MLVFLVFFLLSFIHHYSQYSVSCERVVYVCGMSSVYSVDSCVVCGGELSSTGAVSWRTRKAARLCIFFVSESQQTTWRC